MSQSLYTAMGGISAATTQIQVVSNNVANINTTAFKSSSVNFSDVYSTTLSYGSVSTANSGGTNPIQIGVGTQVSSISKNFGSGSWVATGKDTDLMVQGNGFFTAISPDNQVYFTRAGDFSFDEGGNLVTSKGYKVLGTNSILSATSSASTVQIPKSIVAQIQGNTDIANQNCTTLNNVNNPFTTGVFTVSSTTPTTALSAGTFNITTTGTGATTQAITLSAAEASGTISNLATAIQTHLTAAGVTGVTVGTSNGQLTFTMDGTVANSIAFAPGTSNFVAKMGLGNATATSNVYTANMGSGLTYNINLATTNVTGTISNLTNAIQNQINAQSVGGASGVTVGSSNGQITFGINGTTVQGLGFSTPLAGASNFIAQTNLQNAVLTGSTYASKILDYTANISQLTSAAQSVSVNSKTIGADGSIQATYSNGDTLSVQLGADQATYQFIYTTAQGVAITGENCTVDANVAVPGNFVLQLAGVTNTDGLISVGNNLFKAGPNSGDITYSVGGQMGVGKLASGGLEASNVDLSRELSSMILAQRAIQANSRVFTTTANIMDTITQMGR